MEKDNFLEPDDDADELDLETIKLQDLHQILVGNELQFATDLLKDHDSEIVLRVMRENGVSRSGITDYNKDRINVAVEDGVIKSIINIG